MRVSLLAAAQAETLEVADALNQKALGFGNKFLSSIDGLVANITAHPRMYGRVNRASQGREIREALVPGFPYVAVYEITTEALILSVTHARRSRRPWRQRLPNSPNS